MDLDKFARALRLRSPWLKWKDPSKTWIGSGNPCDKTGMDFLYAGTSITIGDGGIAKFWHAPCLDGLKPEDMPPSIFAISTRKNFNVKRE
jgi:hypothetical protein